MSAAAAAMIEARSPATSCLDEGTVLQFVGGRLTRPARADVREHLARCEMCAELAVWTAAHVVDGDGQRGREGNPFIGQITPGACLARYEILRSVARGGMGEIYEGRDRVLGRRVALKVARARDLATAQPHTRLLREAQALARLAHPNVVALYDVGHAGARAFIVMQLIDGRTADVWLRTRRSGRQILNVFLAAGRGLAAAHAASIVHRDFKPQNIMIGNDGVVRLLDFSLACGAGDAADCRSTRGTPRYMAPEQRRGVPAHAHADQFSFCVALQHALGRARRPAVPSRVRRVLERGMAPDPSRRFQSMERLLAKLSAASP